MKSDEDTTFGNRRRSFWKMSQSNRRRGRSKLRYYRKSHCIIPGQRSAGVPTGTSVSHCLYNWPAERQTIGEGELMANVGLIIMISDLPY